MTDGRKKPMRVSEPVQVYFADTDRARLDHLTASLGATKSDVLRQALRALEQQVLSPDAHPALGLIGLAGGEQAPTPGYDVAREHDRFLADLEDARASAAPKKKPRRRKRGT